MTRWTVVGGGAAGCVVAARLSEIDSNHVTLLEAGPDHGATVGAPGTPVLDRPSLLRPGAAVVRRRQGTPEPYAQGFGVGGSSLVNAGVVVGDVGMESIDHDLPLATTARFGPLAGAVLSATSDAAPVALVMRNGRRTTVADVYLRPALGRPNLTLVPGAAVDRIALDGRRTIGVQTADGRQIEADRVVLCAGAIGTPEILLRSGVDTPGVGEGLQDHAGVVVSFDLRQPAGDAVAIGVTVERPNRQIVVMDRLPGRGDMGAVIAGLLRIGSVGRVTLPDPAGTANVQLDQLSHPADEAGLIAVAREAIELLRAPAVRDVVGDAYADADGRRIEDVEADDGVFRGWIADHLGGYHHLAGSCRVGVALDADGSLRGYQGVAVGDASALPGVPLRNPYLTTVRAAEVLARHWASDRHR